MNELLEFAERTQTPIATTLLVLGAPGHPSFELRYDGDARRSMGNRPFKKQSIVSFWYAFDDRVTGISESTLTAPKKIHVILMHL
jgi:hypothetical protein